ncbi:MAG: rutB [Bradyrhizobium sp.]|nr:rutB [Bradyrhizobium sp.]
MDEQIGLDSSSWPSLGCKARNSYKVSEKVVDMRRPARIAHAVTIAALPQSLIVDLQRTAVVVVDMQNDFCGRDGWMGAIGIDVTPALDLSGPINRVTAGLRQSGVPIIWLNWGVRPDRLNLSPGTQHPFNPTGATPGLGGTMHSGSRDYALLQKDSWGAQIIDELVQAPQDIHVDKHRISGFWDTPLDAILRNLDVTTLIFAGVNADHCVLGTLMDANFHGYDTVLLEDCTATTSPDFCLQATLHNVRFCFGFTTTSADLLAGLTAPEA